MTTIRIRLSKVEDMSITFDETTSELVIQSKTDVFPEVQGLVVPGGTSLTGLRRVAKFLADTANFVILQLQFHG